MGVSLIPQALLIPAFEGNMDAQAMLADYLKENGTPDYIAEEAYVGAIHKLPSRRRVGTSACGNGAGFGSCIGYGAGMGTGAGWGAGGDR